MKRRSTKIGYRAARLAFLCAVAGSSFAPSRSIGAADGFSTDVGCGGVWSLDSGSGSRFSTAFIRAEAKIPFFSTLEPANDLASDSATNERSTSNAIPRVWTTATAAPSFRSTKILESPTDSRLPSTLYSPGVEFSVERSFGARWRANAAVGWCASSDFRANFAGANQIPVSASATFAANDRLSWTIGAKYTDSIDAPVLPIAGVSWRPNDERKIDFVAPRPKLSRAFVSPATGARRRVYLAGEYSGGSWLVERPTAVFAVGGERTDDQLIYREFRATVGIEPNDDAPASSSADVETDSPSNSRWTFETGVAFGRKISFQTSADRYRPGPAVVGRVVGAF